MGHHRIPYAGPAYSDEGSLERGRRFVAEMASRRSVRDFSAQPVPREAIELAISAAASAPSGANRQPWRFVAISDSRTKSQIRKAAEAEEREFYQRRAPDDWLDALAPIGTDSEKPFLETAPWIVVVFAESYRVDAAGQRSKNYYVQESVGIACGLFIAALHTMGLVTLTHTPSPMRFLNEILERPENERPYILFPVGHPADGATVPDISRKLLGDVVVWR